MKMKKIPRQSQWLWNLAESVRRDRITENREKVIIRKNMAKGALFVTAFMILSASLLFIQQRQEPMTALASKDINFANVNKYDDSIAKYVNSVNQNHANKITVNEVKAIIAKESSFNPSATEPNKANPSYSSQGLMGLNSEFFNSKQPTGLFKVTNPFDAEQNLAAGITYYAALVELDKGDRDKATISYHAGPTTLANLVNSNGDNWQTALNSEQKTYLQNVNDYKKAFNSENPQQGTTPVQGTSASTTQLQEGSTVDFYTYKTDTSGKLQWQFQDSNGKWLVAPDQKYPQKLWDDKVTQEKGLEQAKSDAHYSVVDSSDGETIYYKVDKDSNGNEVLMVWDKVTGKWIQSEFDNIHEAAADLSSDNEYSFYSNAPNYNELLALTTTVQASVPQLSAGTEYIIQQANGEFVYLKFENGKVWETTWTEAGWEDASAKYGDVKTLDDFKKLLETKYDYEDDVFVAKEDPKEAVIKASNLQPNEDGVSYSTADDPNTKYVVMSDGSILKTDKDGNTYYKGAGKTDYVLYEPAAGASAAVGETPAVPKTTGRPPDAEIDVLVGDTWRYYRTDPTDGKFKYYDGTNWIESSTFKNAEDLKKRTTQADYPPEYAGTGQYYKFTGAAAEAESLSITPTQGTKLSPGATGLDQWVVYYGKDATWVIGEKGDKFVKINGKYYKWEGGEYPGDPVLVNIDGQLFQRTTENGNVYLTSKATGNKYEQKDFFTWRNVGQMLNDAYNSAKAGRTLSILLGLTDNSWRRTMDEFFVHTVLGSVISGNWEESLCHHYIERPPEGTMYIIVPDSINMVGIGAHVEAERAESQFANQSGQQTDYFYKISIYVKNPEKPTKRGQSIVQDMNFNVFLHGQKTVQLFKNNILVTPGKSFIKVGSSVIVQYSKTKYTSICIEFKDAVFTADGKEATEVCNSITSYKGEPTEYIQQAQAATATGTAAKGTEVNQI